jgi:hypothetical protein
MMVMPGLLGGGAALLDALLDARHNVLSSSMMLVSAAMVPTAGAAAL